VVEENKETAKKRRIKKTMMEKKKKKRRSRRRTTTTVSGSRVPLRKAIDPLISQLGYSSAPYKTRKEMWGE
jgi:hypothetical protein